MESSGNKWFEPSRLGLLAIGSYLLYTCSDLWYHLGPLSPTPLILLAPWFCLLFGLGLMVMAVLSARPEHQQWIGLVAALSTQVLTQLVYAVGKVGHVAPSDTVLLSVHAAMLTLLGENPYGYPMADVYSVFETTAAAMTPHLDGHMVDVLPYPPLHFLTLIPTLGMGLEGSRVVYNFSYLVLVALLYRQAASPHKCLILLPLLVSPEFSRYPLIWSSDSVWTLLLALMLLSWKRPNLRALLFGLACAYKQTPWLLAPFLMVRILKEEDGQRGGRFFAVSFGSFVLINLPFAWANWSQWAIGVFNPMVSPMVPFGRGLSILTQTGIIPFPRAFYGSVTLTLWLFGLWFFWLNYHRLRSLLWLFPALILFFSFRSLQHYFIYSVPLVLFDWILPRAKCEDPSPWKLAPIVAATVIVAGLSAWFWPQANQQHLRLLGHDDNPYRISRIDLEVRNDSQRNVEPRFFARQKWHPYPWLIESGPAELAPGQSSRYTISTDLRYRALSKRQGGQVLMSDARNPDRYCGSIKLDPEQALSQPRVVEAPPTSYWSNVGLVRYQDGQAWLKTDDVTTTSSVSRDLDFPNSGLDLDIQVPDNLPENAAMALDIQAEMGPERVTVLFSGTAGDGYYAPKHFFTTVPFQGSQWNSHHIDLHDLWAQAAFQLPPLGRFVSQDVELLTRRIRVSLILRSPETPTELGFRNFKVGSSSPSSRLGQGVHRPREYAAVLGDFAVRRRDTASALKYYDLAGSFAAHRRVSGLGYFVVPGGRVDIPANYQRQKNWKLFVKTGQPIVFKWSQEVGCQLSLAGQVTKLGVDEAWTPTKDGLVDIEIIPDRPSLLLGLGWPSKGETHE